MAVKENCRMFHPMSSGFIDNGIAGWVPAVGHARHGPEPVRNTGSVVNFARLADRVSCLIGPR